MLKKVMQKIKSFFANLIKALSSTGKNFKNSIIYTLGNSRKERLKKFVIYSSFAVIAVIATVFSLISSLTRVVINDGEKTSYVYTLRSNPLDVLEKADLSNDQYTVTSVNETTDDTVINLRYTFPVFVTYSNETKQVDFIDGDTVADAIKLAGITLGKHDIVSRPLTDVITETVYIDITAINYVTNSYTAEIPFAKQTVYNSSTSSSRITTAGVNGEKRVTTVTKMVNGVKESTDIVSEEVITEAVDEVYTVGTKVPSNTISCLSGNVELDGNGNPVHFKEHITVQATAYSGGTGTASGMKPQPGCVAVNPKIFPYGTKFYIKSSDGKYTYGYAVAGDTGGFVKSRPTNFDLYFNTESECVSFGRRNIEVWVLE